MLKKMVNTDELIVALNNALAWELRAIAMYAHYSAYVSGIHRLQLSVFFNNEVTESIAHASTVRSAIVKLHGKATTERAEDPILHSMDFRDMLEEAHKTELKASETYGEILPMVERIGDSELFDALEVIYFDELRSVEELVIQISCSCVREEDEYLRFSHFPRKA
mgnify:CR=1 FL=1